MYVPKMLAFVDEIVSPHLWPCLSLRINRHSKSFSRLEEMQVGETDRGDVVFSAHYCSLVLPSAVCRVWVHTWPVAHSVVLLSISDSETSHLSALQSELVLSDFVFYICNRSTGNQSTDITTLFRPSSPLLKD